MDTKFIMNNLLLNKKENDIKPDGNQFDSIKMFSSNPEKQSKNVKVMKTPSTVFKTNTIENNNDWLVNKKDSEKTIISNEKYHDMKNKQELDSLSFIEYYNKVGSSKFNVAEESIKSISTATKSEQFSRSETLINEKSIITISTKISEQNSRSKTHINDESYKKPEHNNDSLDSLYEFSSVVNEIDDNLLLPYEVEGYEEKNHKYVLDINNADLNVLSLSSLNEEIRANEIYNYNYNNNNNKNSQLIESQDNSGITISDDSASYDNIFNYNSDIILSDDEEIRKSKINELYNEAVIIKNLDDNTFSFAKEDSYNEYFNNSIDNSENSDHSLFERDPNINYSRTVNNQEVFDSPELIESNESLMNNNYQKNDPKINYKEIKPINSISSKSNNINDINESINVICQSNNDYVNADDDEIYIIKDTNNNNDDEIQCVEEKIKSKKKVTFNEKVKVKRIDKIINKKEIPVKNYIKDELKFGLKKLKKLFTFSRKKENENNRSLPIDLWFYENEFPVITIEYVDDYSDRYHKKELIYSNKNCPRIVIDYIDDFSYTNSNKKNENANENYEDDDDEINFIYEIEEEEEEIKENKNNIKFKQKKRYEKYKENNQNFFIKPILVNNNNESVIEINHIDNSVLVDEPVIENNQVDNSVLVNEPVMEINQVDNSFPINKLDKKDEKLPFYLREEVPSKKKEKQKKAKKFIDKLMRMERNYYREAEKASHELDKSDHTIKENKDIENLMSNSQEENIISPYLNRNSNSIDNKESFNNSSYSNKLNDDVENTSISTQKPTLKKKSASMNYIKNVYKTLKHTFSMSDTSNNNNLDKDDEGVNIYEYNACILGMNLDNENKLSPKISNQTLERNNNNINNICNIEEMNSIDDISLNKISKENVGYKNNIMESKNGKDISKDNVNKIENKLQKYQSSLATMVADVDVIDVANINIINDNFNIDINKEILHKKKGWSSLITLFKKSKQFNSEKQIINDDENDKNLNILKSINTNFNLSNSNVKNFNKTSQKEEIKLFNSFEKENQNQKEIEKYNNNFNNLDKMDSSLTETDILARQISRISDSIETANNELNDYTQLLNNSSINENNAFVDTNINLSSATIVDQNTNDDLASKIETKSSSNKQLKQIKKSSSQKLSEIVNDINNSEIKKNEINKYISSNSSNCESQLIHKTEKEIVESENIKYTTTTTTKKVFSPVILPIDKENDFSKVDTIEIIDEYIFNCSKPCLFNTNEGKKEEIYEILIEDKFSE
ncbi:hypothetical protein H8356DRAFT_192139 [Neocallimastix lanati (nom. inval.)]|nr:hypothetical protein H8356DRAFT_192139 [Neocallimastix sp. JGI-2020a]